MSSALKNSNDAELPEYLHVPTRDWNYGNESLVPVFVPFPLVDAVYRYATRLDEYYLASTGEIPVTVFFSEKQLESMKLIFEECWTQVKLGCENDNEVTAAINHRIELLKNDAQLGE